LSYTDVETIQKVLTDELAEYPVNIDSEVEWAATEIDSKLSGRYELPFDDISKYATVPVLIKWIASYLVGYKIWDMKTILEGQTEDTAGARWKAMADLMLDELKAGERFLVDASGALIEAVGGTTAPRFYPSGVRLKAPSSDNIPYFTRAQAGEW
jgi:phage gp36-like protein